MKLTFWGAAQTVTGSCHIVEAGGLTMLVDCGLHQGNHTEELLNAEDFPINPASIDFLLLTHAHIDHSGRIPYLVKKGFKGKILATGAACDLCGIMLPDSGHIQESEAEWKNKKNLRKGEALVEPLYTFQEALDSLAFFKVIDYEDVNELNPQVKVRFVDAGHMLGSSFIEIWETVDGKTTKIVFSGDVGNAGAPILKDPSIITEADFVVVESTYGNRFHPDRAQDMGILVDTILETTHRGGNVVIPSFAVGRTQEMIYYLNQNRDSHSSIMQAINKVPVYIDSPLATSATSVFRKHLECYDTEARAYIENGDNPLDFDGLQFSISKEDSMALNEMDRGVVIISPSGMCEAGRIKHHLKHNLWRPECTIIFVGFQAENSLGRKILNGQKIVKVFGEEIAVKAQIVSLEGFSGHADQSGLVAFLKSITQKPKKVFIVHGEPEVMKEFATTLHDVEALDCVIPYPLQKFDLDHMKERAT
ncbi:MAG: MBL fold metallo-hydrolase [Clostridia bacterium]